MTTTETKLPPLDQQPLWMRFAIAKFEAGRISYDQLKGIFFINEMECPPASECKNRGVAK